MARVNRIDLVRLICEKVGIRRKHPDHQYLSKSELLRVSAALDLRTSGSDHAEEEKRGGPSS